MEDKKEKEREKFREKIAKGEVMEFTWENQVFSIPASTQTIMKFDI